MDISNNPRARSTSHAFVPVAIFTRLALAPRRASARARASHASREYFSTRSARHTHLDSLARRCAARMMRARVNGRATIHRTLGHSRIASRARTRRRDRASARVSHATRRT
jgi:integrase